MTQDIYLTGITTTGTPHIGNYVGAIRPGIDASKDLSTRHFYFLADYHSLAKNEDPDKIGRSTLEIAASWLALGLDTDHACFYRQSDIPEIPELTWILTSMTAKGLMNRAHSYKAAVQANVDEALAFEQFTDLVLTIVLRPSGIQLVVDRQHPVLSRKPAELVQHVVAQRQPQHAAGAQIGG